MCRIFNKFFIPLAMGTSYSIGFYSLGAACKDMIVSTKKVVVKSSANP